MKWCVSLAVPVVFNADLLNGVPGRASETVHQIWVVIPFPGEVEADGKLTFLSILTIGVLKGLQSLFCCNFSQATNVHLKIAKNREKFNH